MADEKLSDVSPEGADEAPELRPASKKRRRKVPGIYERGNRWRVDTFYKGQRLRESCATLEMAQQNLRKMQSLVDEGRFLEKTRESTVTLGEFTTRYLKWCEDVKQKDHRSKKQRLGVVKANLGAETLLSKITRADIERYQAERLSAQSHRKTPMKPATVNRELAALKHMLTKAVEWGELRDSPARGLKLSKENNRRLRYLTPEECAKLLEACSATMRQVVTVALHTGMRKGEILNLTWSSVNLRERFIELTDQKNSERSTIPLNQTVIDMLKAIPRRLDSAYVWPGQEPSQPFTDLKRQFEKAVTAAKLEGVTFHTLRHSAASHLVMGGVDLATVREILRHKSIEMTLRYAHLAPAHKKAAVDALETALAKKAEEKAETA
jgi:integrase